jgi:putative NADPH-quinone reductase
MTRALVLFAHPCAESFSAALHRTVVYGLAARGWEVDDCDLYAEGFNPVLSGAERRAYLDTGANCASVQGHVDRLRAAEALVLVYPVWNFGFPAILKGYFDRVFLPGVSFRLEDGRVRPNLSNIRSIVAVTTYGATPFRAFLAGDPPRRLVTRILRRTAQARRTRYLALHDMNRATRPKRAAFLARVARAMETL